MQDFKIRCSTEPKDRLIAEPDYTDICISVKEHKGKWSGVTLNPYTALDFADWLTETATAIIEGDTDEDD